MWSRYKVRKVHQIPIVERMWQAIAQQIAAADPKPLRGFGWLSSSVRHDVTTLVIERDRHVN